MSAEDPNKCCRVLLTWELKYYKFEIWTQTTPASVPPKQLAVPGTATSTLNQRAQAILNNVPKILGSSTIGGQNSPRNVVISLDSQGSLQNASDFNGKKMGQGIGRTAPVVGPGTCKRLTKNPNAPKTCNCSDFTNGSLVLGSEKCKPPEKGSEELGPESSESPSTTPLSPRYICRGTVKWEQYKHGYGWIPESRDLKPVTFYGARIPTKVSKGRTVTDVCTVEHEKEMDCCL